MTSLQKYNTFGKRVLAALGDGFVFIPFTILSNRFDDPNDKGAYFVISLLYIICWMLYVVIGHGKYGQTIGKHLMGIKVFDLQEQNVIGYRKAFYREAIWFFAAIAALVYLKITIDTSGAQSETIPYYHGYVRLTMSMWLVLELVTMFFNTKRRALNDLIAGSIIVDVNEMKREDLQRREQELALSLQHK
jgi:uncharacterized RDD family membrane protein YckC